MANKIYKTKFKMNKANNTGEWVSVDRLDNKTLFEIACIIDNEYRQYRYDMNSFIVTRKFQNIKLSTNKSDFASFIGILYDGKKRVTEINVLGEYTDGWQPIQPATMQRILAYLFPHPQISKT